MDFSKLRAVAFDLDGTLYPNSEMVLPSLGFALRQLKLVRALEEARKDLRRKGLVPDFHQAQARIVGGKLGLSPEAAEKLIEEKVYTGWFTLFRRFRTFPGVRQAVEQVRRWNLKTAVMSDFPIRGRLADLGLDGLWDTSFSTEELGALKPHPRGFHEIAERLGFPPDHILYVGNDYGYDVVGAKAVGMAAAHLTKRRITASQADFSFSNYPDLVKWLGSGLFPPTHIG